jgi:hypothetical protein
LKVSLYILAILVLLTQPYTAEQNGSVRHTEDTLFTAYPGHIALLESEAAGEAAGAASPIASPFEGWFLHTSHACLANPVYSGTKLQH